MSAVADASREIYHSKLYVSPAPSLLHKIDELPYSKQTIQFSVQVYRRISPEPLMTARKVEDLISSVIPREGPYTTTRKMVLAPIREWEEKHAFKTEAKHEFVMSLSELNGDPVQAHGTSKIFSIPYAERDHIEVTLNRSEGWSIEVTEQIYPSGLLGNLLSAVSPPHIRTTALQFIDKDLACRYDPSPPRFFVLKIGLNELGQCSPQFHTPMIKTELTQILNNLFTEIDFDDDAEHVEPPNITPENE